MLGTKVLEERISKYNGNLRVVKSWGMGTYIQSDGLTQSGGVVWQIWNSTLRHILYTTPNIQTVLVLGLGGGTVVSLIKKIWPEAKITGVDIDPVIINLGRKYLGLNSNKVEIIIADASQYTKYDIRNTKFDLIIIDLYTGDKFPKKFETKNYIHLIRTVLSSGGMAVFNRLYYKDKKISAEKFGEKLNEVFKRVERYRPISNIMFACSN